MTRRRKKPRPAEPRDPEGAGQATRGTVSRRASGSAGQDQEPRRLLAACGLLLLAVAAVFGKTVLYDFVNFDDDLLVSEHPIVVHGITARGIVSAFTGGGRHAVSTDLDLLHGG